MADFDDAVVEAENKKKSGKGIYIIIVLTVICLAVMIVGYVGAKSYNEAVLAAQPFSAPDSGLSKSLFVAQNSTYAPSDKFPLTYHFGSVPYQCDIPDLKNVRLGNGTVMIYQNTNETRFYYMTECAVDSITQTFIDELSPAVLSTADKSLTKVTTIGSDRGYYNGYDTIYLAQQIDVTEGVEGGASQTIYALSYVFPVENTDRCAVLTVAFVLKNYGPYYCNVLKDWALSYRSEDRVDANETK